MKRIFFLGLMILISMAIFAQSDELAVQTDELAVQSNQWPPLSEELAPWFDAFDRAHSMAEKLIYIMSIVEQDYEGAEHFYARALDALLKRLPNARVQSEWDAANIVAQILSARLGEAQYSEAATNLWRVVEIFPDPLTKAEALIALGRTRNTAFLPHITQLLSSLNISPQSDAFSRENSERIAVGAIRSLEYLGTSEAYLPVFFASVGWYGQRVRNQAANSLANILDNPTEVIMDVIRSTGASYEVRHEALQTSERSQSSDEDKARVALVALTEGWRLQARDPYQRQELFQMRILALNMISRYGTEDPAVYSILDRSYREGDQNERMATVQVLSTLGTEDSAQLLSGYLAAVHVRRVFNYRSTDDEQLVRAIIGALGDLGSVGRTHSRPILLRIQQSNDWTHTVRNLASDSLRQVDS